MKNIIFPALGLLLALLLRLLTLSGAFSSSIS